MPVNAAVAAAVGAAVGAAAVAGYYKLEASKKKASPVVAHPKPSTTVDFAFSPAIKYGLPVRERIRQFSGYTVGFDPSTRNPIWVLEHLNKETAHGDADRKNSQFLEDPLIEPRFRSKLKDYMGSGFDRGHMAPAMNHKHTQKRMDDTFYLSNISPQVGKGFNQDYWARFEKFTKDVVKRADDVYIVTGPMFTPTIKPGGGLKMEYNVIGQFPETVAVPTHYYKVILAEARDKAGKPVTAVGAFVMPNAPIDSKTPLLAFAVPIEVVESVTGIKFFPGYLSDGRRQAVDKAAQGWRKLGKAQQAALASHGVPLLTDAYSTSEPGALVPLSSLPAFEELVNTGVSYGPPAFRPPPTGPAGQGAVHLCEHVACKLPVEEFWKSQSQGRSRNSAK